MSELVYGREALRKWREQQAAAQVPRRQPPLLADIPLDAPMDDATITVWNGERWVAWDTWQATAPLIVDQQPPEREAVDRKDGKTKADPPSQNCAVQIGLWET